MESPPPAQLATSSLAPWNSISSAGTESSSSTGNSPQEPESGQGTAQEGGQTKRLKNCSACRLRRCERIPGQRDCTKCVQKGITCEDMPKRPKRTAPHRSGKRIEAARVLFGPASSTSLAAEALLTLSPTSPSSLLHSHQLTSTLISSLISSYLRFTPRKALIDSTSFLSSYELASHNLERVDEQSQVLGYVLLAAGARYSDHTYFVGEGAPSMEEMKDMSWVGKDLSEWGKRREAKCTALLEEAMDVIDRKGALRKASPESVAALILLDGLLQDRDSPPELYRPYITAYIGHSKLLCDPITPSHIRAKVQRKTLGASPFMFDCIDAASSGRAPLYTDDDILNLRAGKLENKNPLSAVMRRRGRNENESFWELAGSYVQCVVDCARGIAFKLTGATARQATHLDEQFIHAFIDSMTICSTANVEMNERLKLVVSSSSLNGARPGHDVLHVARGLRVTRCSLIFQVHSVVRRRLAARGDMGWEDRIDPMIGRVEMLPGPEQDDEYYKRLEALCDDLGRMTFEACRDVCLIIKTTLSNSGPISINQWNDGRGAGRMFTRLETWLPVLLDEKVVEEGGTTPDWTFATLIDELTWVLKALYAIGWSYESMSRPAIWLRTELDSIIRRRDLHHSGAVVAAHYDPPSNFDYFDYSFLPPHSYAPLDFAEFGFGGSADPFVMMDTSQDVDFQDLLDSLGSQSM